MKEGAVDFITKPFEQGQIDQTVSTFIDRMGQRVEITKLMGEITHDVKNLLMPLVAGTDLLAEEIDDVFRHLPTMERARAEQSHSSLRGGDHDVPQHLPAHSGSHESDR